jgi:hypothetical protein
MISSKLTVFRESNAAYTTNQKLQSHMGIVAQLELGEA